MAEDKKSLQKNESDSIDKPERTRAGKVYLPATDIIETEDEILLVTDMPGCIESSIDITLEDNQLTIEGRSDQQEFADHQLVYAEYKTGDYYRSFILNDRVDREKITANYKHGVLRLTLPKSEKMKARQIVVNAE